MENAAAVELYTEALRQWREAVELGLHASEDIVYGIMPLLVKALSLDPDDLPTLDLLSDLLMEIGAYDEAIELVDKMLSLAPDHGVYQQKLNVLVSEEQGQRRQVRAYLHQKRQQLTRKTVNP
ncbi:MAG: tetratricopeptide repeat protein [Candidatus Competibacteraceae bacterium]|nr:tetratricopeptide repeat protein [Candidatus Competibacteraceae bacterium]HRY15738.1 tetratricopeptide repeat protein [Candidatus Competibacteraceae bacterium]